ncbi:MAG: hypothetical protein KJO06_13000 [Gemmatimonadetes bacterium]|nr:hypothetical protein [Gemmatimonadota bacterium]
MKTGPIALIFASLAAWVGTSELSAQQGVSMSIDGFDGFAWGTSEAAIGARLGEPAVVDSISNGIVVLAYRVDLLGEPSVAYYALLGEEGLVKGQHLVKLQLEEGDCEGQYRVYRDYVTLTYPLIRPIENYDYPFTEDFCTALVNGRGTWANQWTDPENGAVVTVIVQEGTDEVKLIYESAAFLNLIEQQPSPGG